MRKLAPLLLTAALFLPAIAGAQVNAPGSPYTDGACYGNSDCNAAAGYTCDTSIDTCVPTASASPTGSTPNGQYCQVGATCQSGYCNGSDLCDVNPNSGPTPVPTGTTGNGQPCSVGAQCQSGYCNFATPSVCAANPSVTSNGITTSGSGNSPVTTGNGFPTPNTSALSGYTGAFVSFINSALVPALVALAFIVFLWGVANAYILHPDDETKRKEGHQYILWGIIGFVVIFSVWGLVNLVNSTLNLTGGNIPQPPTINTNYTPTP